MITFLEIMDYQTQPLKTLSVSQAADLFNHSFEGYLVPVQFTESAFSTFVQRDNIDFNASQALLVQDQFVGIALIARRRNASRMAGFGITSAFRKQGAGSWFVGRLLEDARLRGETHMYLEVITQNEAAVRLYAGCGFTKIRQLLGFRAERPTGRADDNLQPCEQGWVLDMVRAYGLPDLPWQLDAEALGLVKSFGYRLGSAFALISNPEAEQISLRSLVVTASARRQGQATRLLEALFANYPGRVWHVPAIYPEEMGGTFIRAGMQLERLSQWQMVCNL
jgi:ribosomal protein S18 acetylase RimI-like enzyme